MTTLIARPDGTLLVSAGDRSKYYKCAIGNTGMVAAADKREGDGASPVGHWPLRSIYYRADRIKKPKTRLPCTPLFPDMGWCDAPGDPAYNRLVIRPYSASHEALYREDHVYDVIVKLGHNDRPPVPGLGSAIFLHVARADYFPTEGCIALALADLLALLELCDTQTVLTISF